MGLLKNLGKGYLAGGLIGAVVSGVAGSINEKKEEKEKRKEDKIQQIDDLLGQDAFDNDEYQREVDEYIKDYAESNQEIVLGFYFKYVGWFNESCTLAQLRQENFKEWSQEEVEENERMEQEADEQCLKVINQAFEFVDEDVSDDLMFKLLDGKATSLSSLSEKLEAVRRASKKLEAVRCAIQSLSFATCEKDREWAKSLISGRGEEAGHLSPSCGYGIVSEEKSIAFVEKSCAFSFDPDFSNEDNEDLMELYGMDCQEKLTNLYKYQMWFSNRPYHDRQFIFTVRDIDHIEGCYDDSDNIKYVFPLDEIPKDISFPLGHPQPNTLYYAHPLRAVYLPFENAQLQLFYEKIQEMCRLFQCLGATQITARCLKGAKITEDAVSAYNTSGQAGVKFVNVSGESGSRYAQSQNRESRDEMQLTQTFSPKKAPYCPEDLLWTLNDPELQSLIRQRLEGGLLNFTKKVSSYETSSLSQNQVNDVKAAFENMMANVSANYSSSTDRTFSSTTETEWEISVEFMPLEELPPMEEDKQTSLLKSLKSGKKMITIENFVYYEGRGIMAKGELQQDIKSGDKVLISDGKKVLESEINGVLFTQFGFKILDQGEKGDKVWLQLEGVNAGQLTCGMGVYAHPENEVVNADANVGIFSADESVETLTPEEERYKEEILFCVEDDGAISEEERGYLERKRKKLGISEERAKELEKQFASTLTSDEQEYLETFKEMCAAGTVTDRVRRLLEREREALNISKERADEIEKMVSEK